MRASRRHGKTRSGVRRSRRGASLLEVLVALTLIAVALLTTMSFVSAMQVGERRLEAHEQVLRLLELQMEMMRAGPYVPDDEDVDIGGLLEDEGRTVDLSAAKDVAMRVAADSEPEPFLKRVTLTVTYTVAGVGQEQRLETLMFLP